MLKVCPLYNKFAAVAFIIVVWFLPGNRVSAQSYWDAIFRLGFDPSTRQISNQLACRRVNKIYELTTRISDHLEINPDLQFKMRDLHSRLTSLDAANLYDISADGCNGNRLGQQNIHHTVADIKRTAPAAECQKGKGK